MLVGAFDPSAWTGLVFCTAPGRGFAFRFVFERDGTRFDGYDTLDTVSEVGPCAPDASYARLALDISSNDSTAAGSRVRNPDVTFEWSRQDEHICVGRISTTEPCVLEFRAYFPWDWEGTWSFLENSYGISARGNNAAPQESLAVTLCKKSAVEDTPHLNVENGECVARYSMAAGDTMFFVATISTAGGNAGQTDLPKIDEDEIAHTLAEYERCYEARRVTVDRHWQGLAASITNNLHWMVSLVPERGIRYTPAGRRWIFPRQGGGRDHWTVFCWDAFFNALELAVESPDLARETLMTVLETQYDNGNVPNWRGRFFGTRDRSQPPIGSLVALKLYLRTGDLDNLRDAFPYLDRWSEWWRSPKGKGLRRDGNRSGLFEWGCDLNLLGLSPASWENEAAHHQFAAWESGQDDLPNWDEATWVNETETFDLESVDLNSLIALDYYCLGQIAELLGLSDRANEYRRLYDSLSAEINEHLWDETSGMYLDRFWDGRFSQRMAASNFYPLVAGVAPPDRANRMLETLLDERLFWGEYVLPTISRDDPAFTDQQYWRGTIWPPTNYLVYEGLKRYQFDDAAASLAKKSVSLFLDTWRRFQVCRENYDSRSGEGGGQKYQSWGPLFALMGIEEFIDVTPWDGLRLGATSPPPATTLDRIRVCDRAWRVTLCPGGMSISIDGDELLKSTKPIVFRHLEVMTGGLTAETHSSEPATVSVALDTEEVLLTLDGDGSVFPADAVEIPAGEHSIRVEAAPQS